jgi:hypothetical protein
METKVPLGWLLWRIVFISLVEFIRAAEIDVLVSL